MWAGEQFNRTCCCSVTSCHILWPELVTSPFFCSETDSVLEDAQWIFSTKWIKAQQVEPVCMFYNYYYHFYKLIHNLTVTSFSFVSVKKCKVNLWLLWHTEGFLKSPQSSLMNVILTQFHTSFLKLPLFWHHKRYLCVGVQQFQMYDSHWLTLRSSPLCNGRSVNRSTAHMCNFSCLV